MQWPSIEVTRGESARRCAGRPFAGTDCFSDKGQGAIRFKGSRVSDLRLLSCFVRFKGGCTIFYIFSIKWGRNVAWAETTISRVITAENPGCTLPKLGRISYPSACNRVWGVPFALDSERSPITSRKPVQKVYKPTPNNRISALIIRPESARKTAPAAPPMPLFFGRFLHKSDAYPLMHYIRAVFRPFSLWSGAQ